MSTVFIVINSKNHVSHCFQITISHEYRQSFPQPIENKAERIFFYNHDKKERYFSVAKLDQLCRY